MARAPVYIKYGVIISLDLIWCLFSVFLQMAGQTIRKDLAVFHFEEE